MTSSSSLIWIVLLLPLLGFGILAFTGARIEKALGKRALGFLSVAPLAVAFVLAALVTSQLAAQPADQRSVIAAGIPWIQILGLNIPFELVIDPLSMTMALIVTGVGSLIFLYSTGYMAEEREYSRFFTYMNLFAASMLLLVLANNLALLFVGWEGVGLCSYLLIGFWYKDKPNTNAANKAFIVNRIGDWGLTLGILLILTIVVGSGKAVPGDRALSYDVLATTLKTMLIDHRDVALAAGILLFIGAAGKSAQFPLYLWLPDAMAGPTPVSALIHAATMVTSGVVLLNRLHVVYEVSTLAAAVVCCIGAFTALFAAIIAFGQTDIKRVLAYSTVSQLGYMFIGCGSGAFWAGMFHVTTHAFFKALLFLGAGAVIHAMAHDQNMRNYGNLRKYLPITSITMVIGWLAISAVQIPGVFGFAGAYSKEAILGPAFAGGFANIGDIPINMVAGWIGLFTAVLTGAYMTRLTWLTFFGKEERWRKLEPHHGEQHADGDETDTSHGLTADHTPKEVPPSMWFPLVVLAALSVVGGWWLAQGDRFENWLAPVSATVITPVDSEPSFNLGLFSCVAALLGIAAGWYFVRKESMDDRKWSPLRLLARRQFGYDDALTNAAVAGGDEIGKALWLGFDIGLIDGAVNGAAKVAGGVGAFFSSIQRGVVRSYALLMLAGGILFIGWILAVGLQGPFGGGH